MKRILCLLLIAAAPLFAKEPTVLQVPPDAWNFFFQPQFKFTQVGTDNSNYIGALAGASLNERIDYGVGYNTTINDVTLNSKGTQDPNEGEIWDVGGFVQYHFDPCLKIECSLQLYMGKGYIDVGNKTDGDDAETDFFVVEPQVNVNVNITDHIVMGAGVGYRFADGSDSRLIQDEDLRNVTGLIFIRFDEF
jgi:hypothetical protein